MADERDHQATTTAAPTQEGGGAGPEGPNRRKRRRRRRGKKEGSGSSTDAAGSDAGRRPATGTAAAPAGDATLKSLAAGLFSHLDDRPVPCSVDGCPKTWFWSAQEQLQAFGQPPPRRMCADHQAKVGNVSDREVPCSNPGCARTWTWNRSAQLKAMQRTGVAQPPKKICPHCNDEERHLADREVTCRVDGCKRTWTWVADAQLKHRVWARRYAEEQRGGNPSGGKRDRRRKGRRRNPKPDINEPPGRMCSLCHDKLARIEPREGPCKVHGCTRTAAVDRDTQLRAWARLQTEDLDAHGPLQRRMCTTCRDFCRSHPDREVRCGRPGCEHTWTNKTGAQLQDFLAGRRQDPIRLCEECSKGGALTQAATPDGMEVMPCVVTMCDGVWFYREGVTVVAPAAADVAVDRMCDRCRQERGAEPRGEAKPSVDETPPSTEASAASEREAATPTSAEAKTDTEEMPSDSAEADEGPSV